ncbi:protein IN CHLOROPLAST ATPASE BIOGENESIS, chloroplastic-like isoform X2 [Spinacia oleracea]|uniref:Protein IN CHLOROPLAST ATPASE BIOGENESIS, chloroplastic-like isoform X2 n=1 Tax=Spinacia oleracea TaxID=3562 RepID=A0A9R0JMX9_SPIOL|nr:protein IN CHLOROPLAST ATPASE BIOGENESIS, chloroplastic-like isoform X2 [Spinacia oleracea]
MKIGGVAFHHRRRFISTTFYPTSTFLRFFCSSSFKHISFIKDVAATCVPEHLTDLLNMLQTRGDSIISPGDKHGIFPLAIPLSRNSSGAMISLLRWPTAPSGIDMPVVQVYKHGVFPLAKNVDQYIHRMLVEEDACSPKDRNRELLHVSANAGKLYREGSFIDSQLPNLDTYHLRKVGVFPDILERKINKHLEKGNRVSALITGEFYAKKQHFPGFGRPVAFNAHILMRVGRDLEAKDAARGALKSPWWTLGYKYQEVAEIAKWKDEQICYVKKKLTDEGKREDLSRGKELAQIALDQAAFLLDLASVEGNWDDFVDRISECYKVAGLHDMARFIAYKS